MTNNFVSAWAQQATCPVKCVKPQNQRVTSEGHGSVKNTTNIYASHSKTIVHQVENQERTLLFLENRYLKLMILPEMGGQVQIAADKTNTYHVLAEDQLIKPALIGLSGPWIFGSNEFVWPVQYDHCLNTPLEWRIEEGADGSKTIWCATVDVWSEVHGVNGFRLFPDRAYVEIDIQLYNGTSIPQSVEPLWGANTDPASGRYWLRAGEERRFTQTFVPFGEKEALQPTTRQLAFLPLAAKKVTPSTVALPIFPPEEIVSSAELLGTGLYLEQHRGTTPTPYAPECYYQEGLRRDPSDRRCNNALGLLLYRRGRFAAAEGYFRKAIDPATNPATDPAMTHPGSPVDGEPLYNLGLTLIAQGDYRSAIDLFDKASACATLQDAAYFESACLASRDGRFVDALALVTSALAHNHSHHKARHLKIALLRRLRQPSEAATEIELALKLDLMPYGARWESVLLANEDPSGDTERILAARMAPLRQQDTTLLILALDYRHAGLWCEAIALLTLLLDSEPMAHYFLIWCYIEAGQPEKVKELVATHRHFCGNEGSLLLDASSGASGIQAVAAAFQQWAPSRQLDALLALQCTIHHNPSDAYAFYLLGALWCGYQEYELAVTSWEKARALEPTLPFIHRDLGIAYLNCLQDCEAALAAYERAFALDITSVQIFYELDQLYQLTNLPPQARLDNLELHDTLVVAHDALNLERIRLLNLTGNHEEALDLLAGCTCYTWVGKVDEVAHHVAYHVAQRGVAYPLVVYQYNFALIEQAKKLLIAGEPVKAMGKLYQAECSVNLLGQASLRDVQKTQIYYYMGCTFAALGETKQAQHAFHHAIDEAKKADIIPICGEEEPAIFFYQALAYQKTGDDTTAEKIFQRLIDYGNTHGEDQIQVNRFPAVLVGNTQLKRDLNRQNRIQCFFMCGLGYLGLKMATEASAQFDRVLKLCSDHDGAIVHKRMIALLYA